MGNLSKLNKNVTAALLIIMNRKERSLNLQQMLKPHYDTRIDGYCVFVAGLDMMVC